MMNFYDIETIEKYLSGELDTATHAGFEKALSEDQALQKEVTFHKDILNGITSAGDEDLALAIELAEINLDEEGFFKNYREDIDDDLLKGITALGDEKLSTQIQAAEDKISKEGFFDQKEEKTAKVRSLFNNRLLAIAASLLFLVTAGLLFFRNAGTNVDQIFANSFKINKLQLEEQINALSELGLATSNKAELESLKTTLETYKDCTNKTCRLDNINEYLGVYPANNTAKFYHATSLMEQNQFEKAAEILDKLVTLLNFELQPEAQWNQALCYLKIEPQKSKSILQKITTNTHSNYSQQAQQLLEKLN